MYTTAVHHLAYMGVIPGPIVWVENCSCGSHLGNPFGRTVSRRWPSLADFPLVVRERVDGRSLHVGLATG